MRVLSWIGISLALHIPASVLFCCWANRKHVAPKRLRQAAKAAPLTLAALLLIVGGPRA